MSDGYDRYAANSVWKLLDQPIDFTPNLNSFKLEHKAKRTDLISTVSSGSCVIMGNLLISKTKENIFENFKIPPHQKFEANLTAGKKHYPYFVFHFLGDQNEYIDYEKSVFFIGNQFGFKIEDVAISSYNEYLNLFSKLETEHKKTGSYRKRIRAAQIFIDKAKVNFDFFRLRHIVDHFVVSEKLKDELLANNFTGADFINFDEIKIKVHPTPKDRV